MRWSYLFFGALVVGTVIGELNLIFRHQEWVAAVLHPIAVAGGFLASSFMEWLRVFVLWHPRDGVRRGDEAALRRIDLVVGIVVGLLCAATLVLVFTDWLPYVVERGVAAAISGFLMHQLLPRRLGDLAQKRTLPLFIRLLGPRLRRLPERDRT